MEDQIRALLAQEHYKVEKKKRLGIRFPVDDETMRAVLRITSRHLPPHEVLYTLEIANIEVYNVGKGTGQAFIEMLEKLAAQFKRSVYVENVSSAALKHILEKRGYSLVGEQCYLRM